MKTTKYHFELFKDTFTKYQKMFGLKPGYEVYFQHKLLEEAYAEIATDQESKKVTVTFTTNWGKDSVKELNEDEVKRTALHECLHLFLNRLQWLGRCRFISASDIAEEDHTVVTKLVEIIRDLEGKHGSI